MKLDRAKFTFHKPTLLFLLAVDVVLIGVSVVMGLLIVTNRIENWPEILHIGRDWSISETFNLLKWGAIIVVFGYAFRWTGQVVFACLAIAFTLILADDSLQLHERSGQLANKFFGQFAFDNFGIESRMVIALGEIGFWILLGFVCLAIVLLAWTRTSSEIKGQLGVLAVLFSGVIVCGVFVDFVHFFSPPRSMINGILLVLEDGGEMVFISLMAAFVIGTFGPGATRT